MNIAGIPLSEEAEELVRLLSMEVGLAYCMKWLGFGAACPTCSGEIFRVKVLDLGFAERILIGHAPQDAQNYISRAVGVVRKGRAFRKLSEDTGWET